MENPLKHALREAVMFLDMQGFRYALIGGVANQIWGQARFTYDIDIKEKCNTFHRPVFTLMMPRPRIL